MFLPPLEGTNSFYLNSIIYSEFLQELGNDNVNERKATKEFWVACGVFHILH